MKGAARQRQCGLPAAQLQHVVRTPTPFFETQRQSKVIHDAHVPSAKTVWIFDQPTRSQDGGSTFQSRDMFSNPERDAHDCSPGEIVDRPDFGETAPLDKPTALDVDAHRRQHRTRVSNHTVRVHGPLSGAPFCGEQPSITPPIRPCTSGFYPAAFGTADHHSRTRLARVRSNHGLTPGVAGESHQQWQQGLHQEQLVGH